MNVPRRLVQYTFAFLALLPAGLSAEVTTDYKVASQDILIIEVVGEKDLNAKEFRVSSSGTILFPFLGAVSVKGKTTEQITHELSDALGKDYFVDPQMIVNVKSYRTRTVTVMGQVNKPGAVELPGEQALTIVEAIAYAGGFTKLANQNNIQFTHNGKTETYKLNELRKTNDPDKIIHVEPGDIIEVKESVL